MSSKNNTRKHSSKQDEVSKIQNGCGDVVNNFIEDIWTVMTPEMINRLKCVLRDDMGLSKQDVDNFMNNQREVRRQRTCIKKYERNVRIGPRNQWIKELSKDIADQMASFIVGILLSNRTARTKRITERLLERLCELTGEDTTIESADSRIERTLVVVADRMAKWIDEAITDIEKGTEDKYMSAESLEALAVIPVDLCHIVKTPSSSELSTTKSEVSYISEETTAASILSVTSEEKKQKPKKEKKQKREKTKKKKGTDDSQDEESELSTDESEEEDKETVTEEEAEDELEEEEGVEEEMLEEEEDEEKEEVEEEEDEEVEEEVEEELEVEEEEVEEEVEEEEELEEEEKFEEEQEAEEEDYGEEEGLEEEGSTNKDEDIEKESVIESSKTSSAQEVKQLQGDILDLLKEDIARISGEEEKSERQKAMKKIIDQRLENIAKEKLDQSLDSLLQYDINETASIIANWVEKVLSAADHLPVSLSEYHSQGPAFEVKRGTGSQYEVHQISSTSVAQKVAEVRGIEPPLRKKKIPKTMSPMNLKSGKDWADWALGVSNVGEKWGQWLDTAISDVETHLLSDKSHKSHKENYEDWINWKDKKSQEARKWRAEEQNIANEASLWRKKLGKEIKGKTERETLVHTY